MIGVNHFCRATIKAAKILVTFSDEATGRQKLLSRIKLTAPAATVGRGRIGRPSRTGGRCRSWERTPEDRLGEGSLTKEPVRLVTGFSLTHN